MPDTEQQDEGGPSPDFDIEECILASRSEAGQDEEKELTLLELLHLCWSRGLFSILVMVLLSLSGVFYYALMVVRRWPVPF